MTTVVFLLEEPSAKELLRGLLPRLYPDIQARYIVFEGKQDLEKRLIGRLRGWQEPSSVFVVLRDQDAGDCKRVKARLADLVAQSGRPALVRVACRELEAWVAGDLEAVAEAYRQPRIVAAANKEKFRDPDRLGSPVRELRTLVVDYQKVDGARRIGPLLDPDRCVSQSFKAFCTGLRNLLDAATR